MLAEKNTEAAKALAAPTITSIPTPEKMRKAPPKDSLSTIPLQVIQAAKALDVDLKKGASVSKLNSDNDSDGFDDDLPEDFDPEEMDEDEIAKMMEEEDFAQHQLKLAGEAIRNKKLKEASTEFGRKKDLFPPRLGESELLRMGPAGPMPVIPPQIVPGGIQQPIPGHHAMVGLPPSMSIYPNPGQLPVAPSAKPVTTPKKRGRKIKEEASPDILTSRPIEGHLPPGEHRGHMPPMYLPPMPHGQPMPIPSHLQSHPQGHHILQGQLMHQGPPHPQRAPISHPSIHHGTQAQPIPHVPSVISHSSMLQQRSGLPHGPPHPPSAHPPGSSLLGITHAQEPIIPTTVLAVQNTRLLDPSELGQPPENLLSPQNKKRGRRKKFTPLRESLSSPTGSKSGTDGPAVGAPSTNDPPKSSILSERLGAAPPGKCFIWFISKRTYYTY